MKMWYLYTMEFYLASKKNEILSSKWMELENIILSNVSQVRRPKLQPMELSPKLIIS
jgi:hypothetical protein